MNVKDRYLKFVHWSDEDACYIGFCPDLFPWGGVCHSENEEEAYRELCELVRDEIDQLQLVGKELPAATTRPMREAILA